MSASFLKRFHAEKITDELKRRATAAAIPWLQGQIERRMLEVAELKAAAAEPTQEGRLARATKLTNATRWLGWLIADLKQRRAEPFVTARDVHRYVIKAETDERMCRYCELPGMRTSRDRWDDTRRWDFGQADFFFSYNWDSPFDAVVDAVCTHSDTQVAAGKPPPYYWLDNFAINQHYRTSEEAAAAKRAGAPGYDHDGPPGEWGMTTVACPRCDRCAAAQRIM